MPYGRAVHPFLAAGVEMLKATVIGNLGNDPEMRFGPSGTGILRFNVAANYRAKNEQNEWIDKTEWVRVTVFGQRAETLQNYLKKGTKVYVEGRLEARPWTDNQGQVRAGLEMIAGDVEFMTARQDDGQQQQQRPATQNRRQESNSDLEDLPF